MTNQDKTREKLYSLLGNLPERHRPISAKLASEDDKGSYILETLLLDLNGQEQVPAYFTRPKNAKPPYPVLLYSHAHGGQYQVGKNELIVTPPPPYIWKVPYAEAMAQRGVACLCIDHWCFGERHKRSEDATFKHMLWHGQVMWGMMVYDSLRAVDYLVSRPDVDARRIGAVGISMGSAITYWTAALDPRIKTCVDMCLLAEYDEGTHAILLCVPSLRKHFSIGDINALIAPRPHLSTAGRHDTLTPFNGLKKIEAQLLKVYEEAGVPDGFKLSIYDCGHCETEAMREEVMAFFDKTL